MRLVLRTISSQVRFEKGGVGELIKFYCKMYYSKVHFKEQKQTHLSVFSWQT